MDANSVNWIRVAEAIVELGCPALRIMLENQYIHMNANGATAFDLNDFRGTCRHPPSTLKFDTPDKKAFKDSLENNGIESWDISLLGMLLRFSRYKVSTDMRHRVYALVDKRNTCFAHTENMRLEDDDFRAKV